MGTFNGSRTKLAGDVEVSGNLTVDGTTTTVTTTNTVISDKILELGNGITGTPSGDAGIIIERGSSNNAIIAWDESADGFIVGTTTATGVSSGDLTIAAAPLTASSVTVTVNLDVDGVANLDNVDIDGTLDVVSTAGVSIDAVDDSNITVTASAKDLDISVAGGGTQELRLASAGTGASAIHLNASVGGINIDSADMIDIDAADEITIDTTTADGHIAITSAHTAGEAVLISANANAGSILNMDAGILDIDVQADVTIDADSVKIGNAAAGAGILHIMEDTDNGANYSGFTVGNMAENAVYTLPTADGNSGDVLKTNGSAVLTWGAAGSAAAVAADDIDAGDAAVGISTTSGAITIDSNASSVTVDGHTGVTVQSSNSGNITLDSVADVILDADGDQITMKFGGAAGQIDFTNANSGDGVIQQKVDAKDLVIKQFDGTEVARFTDGGNVEIKNDLYLKSDDCVIHFGLNSDIILDHRPDAGLRLQQTTETAGEPILSLKNTGNFTSGPGINFALDNRSGEDDGDILGFMNFIGFDSSDSSLTYARIEAQSADVTNGSEDGALIFKSFVNGTDTNLMDINNTVEGGVRVTNNLTVGGTLGVTGLATMKPGSNTAQLKLEQNNATDGWSIFADSSNGFLEFTRIGTNSGLKISMEHNGGHFGIRSDNAAIKFGVNADVTLTHVHDTGLILNSSRQLQFGDSATHIKQVSDSNLEIEADGSIILDSPVVDFQDDGVILKFGDDSEVTLTHVHDTGLLLSDASGVGTTKLMFGDAACFIQQQADGQLGIDADSIINVTAPTLDIDASTAVTVTTPSFVIDSGTGERPLVVIKNTANDVDGAILRFVKDKGSAGAANDFNGRIQFFGDDAAQDQVKFSEITSQVKVHTNGQEGGKLSFLVAENDGTATAGLIIEDGDADGELDVTIGAGLASVTTVSGGLQVNGPLIAVMPSVHNFTGNDTSATIPVTTATARIDANGSGRTGMRFASAGTAGQILVVINTGGENVVFHPTEGTANLRGTNVNKDTILPGEAHIFVSDGSLWNHVGGGKTDEGLTG